MDESKDSKLTKDQKAVVVMSDNEKMSSFVSTKKLDNENHEIQKKIGQPTSSHIEHLTQNNQHHHRLANNVKTCSNDLNFDDDNDDDNDDDDDDEDEIEPKLTYSRIRGDVPEILKNQSITCIAIHEKFFVLGTESGKMFILNIAGDNCSNKLTTIHRSGINQISIDEKADFIASCSDHKVVINELYSDGGGVAHYSALFERPVKAFSIDPQYSNSNTRRFVVGEADRLLLYEKNLIGRYKATCLQQARGVVRCISWRHNFIVWSSDLCAKIYDVREKTIITHLDREKENDYRIKLDLYQCSLSWKDNRTLLIAWGNSIKICSIRQKSHDSDMSLTNVIVNERARKYYVELIYSFNIENHLIACGVAAFEDRLLILCANKSLLYPTIADVDDLTEKKLIRIKMVEPKNAEIFTDISDDILAPNELLRTVQKSRDINIIHYQPENLYLIVCPKDLIIARPREEDDSIDWLLSRAKFKEAFTRVKSNRKCIRHTFISVGQLYIKHLLNQATLDSCEEAGKICRQLCLHDWNLWEEQLNLFKQYGCLRVLTKYLPNPRSKEKSLKLKPQLYEMVLTEFLQTDSQGFLNMIRTLEPHLYSTTSMINHTTNKLSSQPQDQNLLEALAELYTYECRYRKALFIFLQVGNAKKVFELIWKHQLLHLLEDRIVELLQLDPEETSRVLILNQDSIPCDKVVSRLHKHPRLLCAYLDRLIYRDPTACAPYHDLLFDLYATYEPNKIVPFLHQSNYIQLEKALDVCKKQNLTKAVVFILGRMGNTHEALRIIIDKMDDINAAIEFYKEHGDSDLWAELMDISVSKPKLLSTLLHKVGTYAADPIGLIARIPEGLKVPDLVPSLVRILQDYRLMVTLEDGCRQVLNSDCYNLFSKFYKIRSRAVVVKDSERYCHCCRLQSATSAHGIYEVSGQCILFQCGHLFHYSCLHYNCDKISRKTNDEMKQLNKTLCMICQTKEKKSSPIIPSTAAINIGNNLNNVYQ